MQRKARLVTNLAGRLVYLTFLARWQSGHAAACKAVYAGSIPTLAFRTYPATSFRVPLCPCYVLNLLKAQPFM